MPLEGEMDISFSVLNIVYIIFYKYFVVQDVKYMLIMTIFLPVSDPGFLSDCTKSWFPFKYYHKRMTMILNVYFRIGDVFYFIRVSHIRYGRPNGCRLYGVLVGPNLYSRLLHPYAKKQSFEGAKF